MHETSMRGGADRSVSADGSGRPGGCRCSLWAESGHKAAEAPGEDAQMTVLIWIVIVLAILVVLVGLFALVRRKQRGGDVLASRSARKSGGST